MYRSTQHLHSDHVLLQRQFRGRGVYTLTHWGRVTHTYVSKLTIIASDNGSSPGRRQAIIWTSAEILLIGPLGTNFSEILIEIITFSFKKMRLKVSSAKWRPCCLGLNVLSYWFREEYFVFWLIVWCKWNNITQKNSWTCFSSKKS